MQRQFSDARALGRSGMRPAVATSERTRGRMRRDRAVVALRLEDTVQLPHGVLAELVQARGRDGRAEEAFWICTVARNMLFSFAWLLSRCTGWNAGALG